MIIAHTVERNTKHKWLIFSKTMFANGRNLRS